jgi:hypothetical protein
MVELRSTKNVPRRHVASTYLGHQRTGCLALKVVGKVSRELFGNVKQWRKKGGSGLPDFCWYRKPKIKIYAKLITKCTKRPLNTPNGLKIPNAHKIYPNLPFQCLKSYAKI